MFIELIEPNTKKKILINVKNINYMVFNEAAKELEITTINKEYRSYYCDKDLYKELKKKLHITL